MSVAEHQLHTIGKRVDRLQLHIVFNEPNLTLEMSGAAVGAGTGAAQVLKALEKLSKDPNFKSMTCTDLFNEIAKEHTIAVKYISGAWLDVDTIVDFQNAGKLRL